ncbi:MAG: DegQ family serine endoprotease [Thermodesulfobacteriota bacterium]
MKALKKIIPYLLIVLMIGFLPGFNLPIGAAATDSSPVMIPGNFSEVAATVGPVVVNISTVKSIKGGGRVFRHFGPGPFDKDDPFQDFFNKFFGDDQQREFKQRSLGTGFIIDKAGFIVTNNHVVENADKIKAKLKSGDEFDAVIVGRDPNTDLALIKIDAKKDLPTAKIGDSDSLRVGQWVVAIGSPFGFEQTVTAGIVSAKGRVIGSGPYDDFIQTDASINPGNSGGPLINLQGEVVGINTAIIASGQGIGFAIPINMAKGIVDQLKSSGEVTRGWLGVSIQPLSSELAAYYGIKDGKGVLVTDVFKGDPADQAGVRPQDIILEVNGKKVGDSRDLTRTIANMPVGETVTIKLLREGKEQQVKVKLSKREDSKTSSRQQQNQPGDELGIQVAEITTEMMQQYNLPKSEGVIVVDLDSQGKGAEAGVQVGDIVVEINYKKIKVMKDYNEQMRKIKKGEKIKMLIQRLNAGFIVVEIVK